MAIGNGASHNGGLSPLVAEWFDVVECDPLGQFIARKLF
jgi:hypothetical protein